MPENSNYEKSELDKFVLKVIPKDNEARNLLTTTVKAHLLFTSLDDETISKIVGAMDRVECETGAVLITQGTRCGWKQDSHCRKYFMEVLPDQPRAKL